ncbi:MAG: hypothetical protein IPL79_20000 [Myxococcales bacterium]|nr:hypothetical protein [Myxococcales bacterium]
MAKRKKFEAARWSVPEAGAVVELAVCRLGDKVLLEGRPATVGAIYPAHVMVSFNDGPAESKTVSALVRVDFVAARLA